MQFPNWIRAALQKTIPFSSPSGTSVGRIQYAPTTGYVFFFEKLSHLCLLRARAVGRIRYAPTAGYLCSFKIPMRSPNRVRVALRKTVPFSSPSGPLGEAYSIRPYNWIRVTLRNTDVIPQPGTCEGSKNGSVFVPFGAVCGAYAIRPYDRVRAILRNTDAILRLGTCEGSKTDLYSPPSVTYGGAYAIRPYDWVCAALQKTIPFSSPSGPLVGRM